MSNIKEMTEIVIVHLLDLEDGLIRLLMQFEVYQIAEPFRLSQRCLHHFIQQMRYNSHKQRLHK